MHAGVLKPRPSGHFDSLAARKYPKILGTICSIVCYNISSKEEHRATPERRESTMTYGIKARVAKTKNGFGIEFVNNIGEHVDWLNKSNNKTKEWRFIEQAEKSLESLAKKYGWVTA